MTTLQTKTAIERERATDLAESAVRFDPPRWSGGPLICTATNLPAHETRERAVEFLKSIAMDGRIKRLWQCPKCNWWHHECKAPTPSGASSGTERE